MKSRTRSTRSTVVMAAFAAPVSTRALSTTSRRTDSRSRLSLIRRLAALSRAMRSRSLSIAGPGSSVSLNRPSFRMWAAYLVRAGAR